MSNVEADPRESAIGDEACPEQPVRQFVDGHSVALGGPRGFEVTRTLPARGRRMVGAWCFLDSYGPHDVHAGSGMVVPAHPHIGLQTVSWLLEGSVMHRDSVGSAQLIRPGQLNLMTAGHGISHSEVTPADAPQWLHGVQLWVALPDAARSVAPGFEHHAVLPVVRLGDASATVLLGTLGDVTSPATAYTPIAGADIDAPAGSSFEVPLRPEFEYAIVMMAGSATVDGETLDRGPLLYLGPGRSTLSVSAPVDARLLLLGGEPFEEQLVMWWNFVGRTHDDIVEARSQWMTRPGSPADSGWLDSSDAGPAEERFGRVEGPEGTPMLAPAMPGSRLRPRGRER